VARSLRGRPFTSSRSIDEHVLPGAITAEQGDAEHLAAAGAVGLKAPSANRRGRPGRGELGGRFPTQGRRQKPLTFDNGVRTIIVETANRFARDLMVQEVGYAMLRSLGVTLVAADSPSSFLDDGPTSNLIRQILGAVSEFDNAMTVAKLKGARDRVRRARGPEGLR
jgi:resolvase-like protein